PAREEARPQQAVRYLDRVLAAGDAGEQHLAGVGAAHAAGALGAVERERIGLDLRAPEARLEALGQQRGLRLERARAVVPSQPPRAARHRLLGAVDVGLHLRQRDRALGQAAVGVEDGVLGILPALVGEALLGGAIVFD